MFKYEELDSYISTLDTCRKELKQAQNTFKQKISSKLTDKEKKETINKRLSNCVDAYYKYLDYLESIAEIFLSDKYKDDSYFKSCIESEILTTKLNYILKEKYPNIWKIKCGLLGEITINTIDPNMMAKAIKDLTTKNSTSSYAGVKIINTEMTKREFYAEFGTRMLYIIGVELEKFYKYTVHVLKAGRTWDAKDKREIRYIINIFKSCRGHDNYISDTEMKRWKRKVDRAIGLYQKHWYGLWN